MPFREDTNKLYSITFSGVNPVTIKEYLDSKKSVAHCYADSPNEFCNIVGEDGKTNFERIKSHYKTPEEKRQYENATYETLPIKNGTILYLENKKVNEMTLLTKGIEIVTNDDVAFKAEKLAELEADKGYVSVNKVMDGYRTVGTSKDVYPDCTVWIWCRALSDNNDEGELKGQFFDLSPFIIKLETNCGRNGGNFQITLPPIVCELDENNKWILKKENITQYNNPKDPYLSLSGQGYVADASIYHVENEDGIDVPVRNQFLFNNMITSNDLVFIRFETLQMEEQQRYKDRNNFQIDQSVLANRIYDMIGLVDDTIQTTHAVNNDLYINITGRDLSKLFLEDGTYFYALENSQGMLRLAGQATMHSDLINRVFSERGMEFIGLYQFQSIQQIFKFVIQQLSNIKIVPNDLFTSYKSSKKKVNGIETTYDGRNTRFNEIYPDINRTTDDHTQLPKFNHTHTWKKELNNGIWQIVKLVIDKSVTNRRLADSSFSIAMGPLINFFRKAAQEPLVEYYSDTYGDQFHLIVRKPPFDQKSVVSMIEGTVKDESGKVLQTPPAVVDIEDEDVLHEALIMNDNEAYSWYHFVVNTSLINTTINYSNSYLPAIFFPEYGDIWGARQMQVASNYYPYAPLQNGEGDKIFQQACYDYKYLIESYQYLPFTRKGTLVLNGDRRIKIGNFIRYKPTGEIFYVDAVKQNLEVNDKLIDRTTVVEVSRGMVEQLIYGIGAKKDGETNVNHVVSYFNIINTTLNWEYKETEEKVTETVPDNSHVQEANNNFAPGFSEYMQHQQGARGAREIGEAVRTGNESAISPDVLANMRNNVGNDFTGPVTGKSFFNYWKDRYNQAYQRANPRISRYEALLQSCSQKTGVPLDVLKAFAEIESTDGTLNDPANPHQGIMQVTQQYADTLNQGYNILDPRDNVLTMCAMYNQNKRNKPFDGITSLVGQRTKTIEKVVKTKGLDLDAVFKNFIVNKFVFNFFLKNLQFDPRYRKVKSRMVLKEQATGGIGSREVVVGP